MPTTPTMKRSRKHFRRVFTLGCILLTKPGQACTRFQPTGFMAAHPQTSSAAPLRGGLTEAQSREVLARVASVYAADARAAGASISMDLRWSSELVNAGGGIRRTPQGVYWDVIIHGHLARHPVMTPDALAMIVCHEIGHSAGGAPLSTLWGNTVYDDTLTNEGQADYFAALKCFRRYQRAYPGATPQNVPRSVKANCDASFPNPQDTRICQRSAIASLKLSAILREVFTPYGRSPSFETPEQTRVTKTRHDYPSPQCRLDTMYQAALCSVNEDEPVSRVDTATGTCHPRNGTTTGNRPLCWFAPEV